MSEPLQHLVQAARHNDQSAWDALFHRYQLPLFAYARGLTGDRQAALEVVQESFIRAAAHVARLREDDKFGSWIFGIAHQRCVLHFRRARRTRELFDGESGVDAAEAPAPDPRDVLLSAERTELLYLLVERLPVPQRSALLLHVLEDFTLEEIARIAQVPLGTVKSRLHHAKRALRGLIEGAEP